MCLLLVAHDADPDYRLIVAANRDEYHARPTQRADHWHDEQGILGGRDLEGGGTWLAVDDRGRFAALTNVRTAHAERVGLRSRGLIVTDFLSCDRTAPAFAASLAFNARNYDGFNLLAYDGSFLVWYSNQTDVPRTLAAGVYTLSNALLDTRWPKTERLRSGFQAIMANRAEDPAPALLELLRDSERADDEALPNTGVGRDTESLLSSIFIEGAIYGTRCSTVLTMDRDDGVRFCERRYDSGGNCTGDSRFAIELARTAP